MSVVKWTDHTYDIHHWKILWGNYRKLAWVGFEQKTIGFSSEALFDWVIRPSGSQKLRPSSHQVVKSGNQTIKPSSTQKIKNTIIFDNSTYVFFEK